MHGNVSLTWRNDILEINTTGPWNMEFFNHLHQALFEAVRLQNETNFLVLLNIKGEAVATPDAQAFHTEFLKASSARAIAVNINECQTKSMTRDICHQVYQGAGLLHQCFLSRADALAWLKAHK